MRIAFDVDGVVLKSIDIILEAVNIATGRNLVPDDLANWDLEPLGLDVRTLRDAVDYMYAQPEIEPYEHAVTVLSQIHEMTGEPLLFITGRDRLDTARRQLEALPWNAGIPEIIVTGGNRDKRGYLSENSVDFIVEDDPRHLREYLEMGFGVGLMVQPWNRASKIPVTRRFEGWRDLEQWFSRLASGDLPVQHRA